MNITRDPSIERWLLDEMITSFSKERTGIHLSDLISPRKAYWQKTKPMKPTDAEVMYWLTGRGHEDALHRTSGYPPSQTKEWCGIQYSTDMFHNFPAEIKTRRGQLAPDGQEKEKYDHYLAQLEGYCAIVWSLQGWLHVWSLVERQDDFTTAPELACYRVEFTEKELEQTRDKLMDIKYRLELALEGQISYQRLPLCASWMCGKTSTIIIEKPVCLTCGKEFESIKGASKHPSTKAGTNKDGTPHKMKDAVVKYQYDARCKWFHDCQPFNTPKEEIQS